MQEVIVLSAHEEKSTKMVYSEKKKGHYFVQKLEWDIDTEELITDNLTVAGFQRIVYEYLAKGYKVVSIANTPTGRGRHTVGFGLDSTVTLAKEVE